MNAHAASRHDAIVVGAGHNGLVAACYLARAGLDVLVLERNAYIGGAAVSRQLYEDFTYSNCSYVCSLLRTEIIRGLELPRFGLQIIPYEGGCTMMRDGGHLARVRQSRRHAPRDRAPFEAAMRKPTIATCATCCGTAASSSRCCCASRPIRRRSSRATCMELLYLGKHFHKLGEARMYDTLRFWTMSCADLLDEYFESEIVKAHLAGSSIIGTALGPRSPGTAYVLLHHYMGSIDGAVGAWGFARGGMGAVTKALAASLRASGGTIRSERPGRADPGAQRARHRGRARAAARKSQRAIVVSNLDVKRTFLETVDAAATCRRSSWSRCGSFKIRGSSGKLNIALDGLPQLSGHPAGFAQHARRHARHRHASR